MATKTNSCCLPAHSGLATSDSLCEGMSERHSRPTSTKGGTSFRSVPLPIPSEENGTTAVTKRRPFVRILLTVAGVKDAEGLERFAARMAVHARLEVCVCAQRRPFRLEAAGDPLSLGLFLDMLLGAPATLSSFDVVEVEGQAAMLPT